MVRLKFPTWLLVKNSTRRLVHQVVTAYLAGARQGTKAQKTVLRFLVAVLSHGVRKVLVVRVRELAVLQSGVRVVLLLLQQPRDYSQKVNKKMYRAAMRCIFSELVRQDRLVVVEEFAVESPKTKQFVAKLNELELDNALLITEDVEQNLYLASRNVPHVDIRDAAGVDPVSLVGFDKVLVTVAALKKIEEKLA